MKANFDACLRFVLQYEGGYVDDPRDPGGATNLGVTKDTLETWRRRPVTKAEVRALTRDEAAAIYRKLYWDAIGGDILPAGVDLIAFDIAVNMGAGRARQWLGASHGLPPRKRMDWLAAKRMGFWRRLRTWRFYGRGWSNRGNAAVIAANHLAMADTRLA